MDESPDPSPFAAAAAYYDRFRAPYAPGAFNYLRSELGLKAGARVLDVGCGPGTIAIPLSRTVAEVVAVDPDAAMLAEGRRLAAEQGRGNIRWVQARAEDLGPELGRFRAATLGQSLHWMDRDRVLALLGALVEDGGALAILDEGAARPAERWVAAASPLVDAYLGRRPRHPLKHPEVDHVPSLRRSRYFRRFTVREFPVAISRDVTSILGCIYSSVSSTRPMFGDRAGAFEAELAATLLRIEPSGRFEAEVSTAVFVAPRR